METLTAIFTTSLIYTFLVFVSGFICGTVRVPILEPLLGERVAHLPEMPLMTVLIWRAANVAVDRIRMKMQVKGRPGTKVENFFVGVLGLVWLLMAEIGLYMVVHRSEDKGWKDWVWDRDPVAGSAFFGALVYMMVLPGVLA